MVLDEVGQVDKEKLNKAIIATANDIYIAIEKCKELSGYIAGLSNSEFEVMLPGPNGGVVGYSTATRNHIKDFGVALLNIVEAAYNTVKTGTGNPSIAIIEMKNPITLK